MADEPTSGATPEPNPTGEPTPQAAAPSDVPMPTGDAVAFEAPTADAPAAGGAEALDAVERVATDTQAVSDALDSGIPDQAMIDELLKQASFDDPSAIAGAIAGTSAGASSAGSASPPPPTEPFELPNFQQVMADAQVSSIDLLRDVELNVKIELGRSRMLVEDVLKLAEGSVVELDKLAGDPVDVFVNDRLVARGEVLVLNESFCVRVNEIVAGLKDEGI